MYVSFLPLFFTTHVPPSSYTQAKDLLTPFLLFSSSSQTLHILTTTSHTISFPFSTPTDSFIYSLRDSYKLYLLPAFICVSTTSIYRLFVSPSCSFTFITHLIFPFLSHPESCLCTLTVICPPQLFHPCQVEHNLKFTSLSSFLLSF